MRIFRALILEPQNSPMTVSATAELQAKQRKREARMFVIGLAERLEEIGRMAQHSRRFKTYEIGEYAQFKAFFLDFLGRVEEFQHLSQITESALVMLERKTRAEDEPGPELETSFRRLQVAMLQRFVATQLRLLHIWDERWRFGEGLPFGSRELFTKSILVIQAVKEQLLRPRYIALLDEQTIEDAENAERLVRALIKRSPRLAVFDDGIGGRPLAEPYLPGIEPHAQHP